MQKIFPVGPGVHLKGPKMTSRLKLDEEKGILLYHDPDNDTFKEVDGILQVTIGVERENRKVNQLPFLPMPIEKGKSKGKSFSVTCRKCLMERRKKICPHNMMQCRWWDTYTVKEVGYAVCQLGYILFSIEECLIYTNLQLIFEEFMRLMASKKIRFGKVPKSYQQDLGKYCQDLNEMMNFTEAGDVLTPELLH